MNPKITIITVSYNAQETIAHCLKSVASQSHANIEHIVVDGGSSDGTTDIIDQFPHLSQVISEPDEGMYHALNKGVALANGDYIGILNADDRLHNHKVIENLVCEIEKDHLDIYFGDVRFIKDFEVDKTIRYYSSAGWSPDKFAKGFMPAHPSCYIRKNLFEKFGDYKEDYFIAADYELLIRHIWSNNASHRYLPILMVDMLTGGRSNATFKSRWILNKEIVRGCRENGIKTNMPKLGLKYFTKIFEYLP